jgi:hypothetical protein
MTTYWHCIWTKCVCGFKTTCFHYAIWTSVVITLCPELWCIQLLLRILGWGIIFFSIGIECNIFCFVLVFSLAFLLRFQFCFWAGLLVVSGSFSKHLCHLLAQVFKVGPLPLFYRGGGFLYWSARPHSFSCLLGGVLMYRFLSVMLCFLETCSLS